MRLSVTLLLACTLLAGCAHRATEERAGIDAYVTPSTRDSEREILLRALSLIGVPYRYGGTTPESGFDCSGLVQYVFGSALGLSLPRRSQDMSRVGETVERTALSPGDLVFFDTLREPYSHVGIYLGEGRFIHAPSSGGRVEIVSLRERYWTRRYNGARRVSY
jgi:cell wall-associated NlpC family hydrolase